MADPVEAMAPEPLVSRDRERARVVDLLDQTLTGRGRLVIISGEAGIGKTRLAEAVAATAVDKGFGVVWARSADRASSAPYGLWRMALQQLPIDLQRGREDSPDSDLWSVAFGGSDRPAAVGGSEADKARRFALFNDVMLLLAQVAEPAGLLVVLDDLQWADEPSLLLLRQIARHVRSTRVLIVATCRALSPSIDANDDTIGALSIDPSTERVELKGLESASIPALLRTVGLSVSEAQVEAIHAETGGNPFLVRELARVLVESPEAALGSRDSVPVAVLDATTYRISRLPDGTQAVLRAAAVAGNSFSIGVVARMLDAPVLSLCSTRSMNVRAPVSSWKVTTPENTASRTRWCAPPSLRNSARRTRSVCTTRQPMGSSACSKGRCGRTSRSSLVIGSLARFLATAGAP